MSAVYESLKATIQAMPESSGFEFCSYWDDSERDANKQWINIFDNGGVLDVGGSTTVDVRFLSAKNSNDLLAFQTASSEMARKLSQITDYTAPVDKISVISSAGTMQRLKDGRFVVTCVLQVLYCTGYNL